MKNTYRLLFSTLIIFIRSILMPLVSITIAVVMGLIFHSWLIPVAVAGIVIVLIILNRLRPQNYVLIARNVTYSYEYLKKNYSKILENEYLLLLATGMVAASPYLSKSKFTLADVIKAIKYAKIGQLYLMGSHDRLHDTVPYGIGKNAFDSFMTEFELESKNDLLLHFTLNLEALELAADNVSAQIKPQDILQAVKDAKYKTYKAIEEARKKATTRIPPGIISTSKHIMSFIDLNQLKASLNDISDKTCT